MYLILRIFLSQDFRLASMYLIFDVETWNFYQQNLFFTYSLCDPICLQASHERAQKNTESDDTATIEEHSLAKMRKKNKASFVRVEVD